MSKLLEFEILNNTRDLGGMKTEDGYTVKSGLLFRSGYLFKASAGDVEKLLTLGLSDIIDFRSYNETLEQPDPQIGTAAYVHLPAEDENLLGIERDKKSEKRFTDILIDRVVARPSYAVEYMCGMYRRFISNEYTVARYREFLDIVLNSRGGVLWHCTAGKDRAGFAAVLIEEILGVPREEIRRDYLLTNTYIKEEADYLIDMFSRMYHGEYPVEAVRNFFAANEEFLDALYEEADKAYGSFDGYLKKALNVDDEIKDRFRQKYLEQC